MKTIKVRIACAVDTKGGWAAAGNHWTREYELANLAADWLSPRRHPKIRWIEAEVPVPESQVIKGEVKK